MNNKREKSMEEIPVKREAESSPKHPNPWTPNVNVEGLPVNLQARLSRDLNMPGHYSRMTDINNLDTMKANSGYCCNVLSCCNETIRVDAGHIGLLQMDCDFHFLAPGYHKYATCGTYVHGQANLAQMDKAVVNGPTGFVTISEGRIGVLQVMGDFKLLAPGTYQWFSVSVTFLASVDIRGERAALGPYTLVTVPEGFVAVTFNNGELIVLGNGPSRSESRTYFLDDPKWVLESMLSVQNQCDRLEDNDLLSKDNVELLMVAMSQWKIVDPVLAVTECGSTMDKIRLKANSLVRAAIARIVAGTNIGTGGVVGGMSQPLVMAKEVNPNTKEAANGEEADLAHMMKSGQAQQHMAELTMNMSTMGIHVIGVFVPEKRMKNDDIRSEVAKQAVIGIKAEAERSAADAAAYATITAAKAQAQAILELAKAHTEAGRMLGNPNDTAARLALTEKTAEALKDAKVTIFSGSPGNMPFMLNATPQEMR